MAQLDERYFYNNNSNQTSIEATLEQDEQILWRGKPHKGSFILDKIFKMLPIVIVWLAFDSFFIIMIFNNGLLGMPSFMSIGLIIFFLIHLMPVWIWLKNVLTASTQHKNLEYVFTNKRIIIRSGVIGIDYKNIYYTDISGVNLRVGLVDKMFKVGDIYITALRNSVVLYDIKDPYFITSKLQKICNDIKSDIYFPNALRKDYNEGFNTKYKG